MLLFPPLAKPPPGTPHRLVEAILIELRPVKGRGGVRLDDSAGGKCGLTYIRDGQDNGEGRALPGSRLQPDATLVVLHDRLDDCQAEA